MSISFRTARRIPTSAGLVAYGLTSDQLVAGESLPAGTDAAVLERMDFQADVGQVQIIPADDNLIALVGLGPADDLDVETLRCSASALARAVEKQRSVVCDLASVSGLEASEASRAVVEGIGLAAYRFGYSTKKPAPQIERVVLVGSVATAVREAVEYASAVVEGVALARDLVNEPGGKLTSPAFANRVRRMASGSGIGVKVLDEAGIKRAKMGGLLGVNRGSSRPPRFVELDYRPKGKASGCIALVGKGLTFDAGGLSIKPAQGMMHMKMDMAGAAAVVGAFSVLPVLAPKCRVRGYLPMTDNMLGGDATRPGDVLTIRNGKTIEVLNTDAEGRLVLADALSLASEAKPDAIVDLATLTGACVVALGPKIAGLMGRNDNFLTQVEVASQRSGERVWQLPLPDSYRKMVDSSVADMKNIGGPDAGAITAGLILQEFVATGIPWAHLDIAGPAFADTDDAEVCKGGTGFGVRLLLELIQDFSTRDLV